MQQAILVAGLLKLPSLLDRGVQEQACLLGRSRCVFVLYIEANALGLLLNAHGSVSQARTSCRLERRGCC